MDYFPWWHVGITGEFCCSSLIGCQSTSLATFTKQSNVVGIATKTINIGMNPLQRRLLVLDTVVTRVLFTVLATKNTQTVIHAPTRIKGLPHLHFSNKLRQPSNCLTVLEPVSSNAIMNEHINGQLSPSSTPEGRQTFAFKQSSLCVSCTTPFASVCKCCGAYIPSQKSRIIMNASFKVTKLGGLKAFCWSIFYAHKRIDLWWIAHRRCADRRCCSVASNIMRCCNSLVALTLERRLQSRLIMYFSSEHSK